MILEMIKFFENLKTFFRCHDNVFIQGQIFISRLKRRKRIAPMNNEGFEITNHDNEASLEHVVLRQVSLESADWAILIRYLQQRFR